MGFLNSPEMIIGFIVAWAVFLVLYTAQLKKQLLGIVTKVQKYESGDPNTIEKSKNASTFSKPSPFTFSENLPQTRSGVYWIYSSTQKHKCMTTFCAWLMNLYSRCRCDGTSYYHLIGGFDDFVKSAEILRANAKTKKVQGQEKGEKDDNCDLQQEMITQNHIWIVEPNVDNQDFQRWIDFFSGDTWKTIHRETNIHLFICTPRFPIDTLLEYETDGMFLLNMNRASELEDLTEVYHDIFPSVEAASNAVSKHCAFLDNDKNNELETRGTALFWPSSPPIIIDEATGETRSQLFTVDYN